MGKHTRKRTCSSCKLEFREIRIRKGDRFGAHLHAAGIRSVRSNYLASKHFFCSKACMDVWCSEQKLQGKPLVIWEPGGLARFR